MGKKDMLLLLLINAETGTFYMRKFKTRAGRKISKYDETPKKKVSGQL